MMRTSVLPEIVVRGRRNPRYFALGQRLALTRKQKGGQLIDLAAVAGVADTTILHLEKGRKAPQIATVERIARALGVSPCWLAFGIDLLPSPGSDLQSSQVGQRLLQVRGARGLTRNALGKLAGTTGQTVDNIERGVVSPSVATVEALARTLDCDVCWLAFREGTAPDLTSAAD